MNNAYQHAHKLSHLLKQPGIYHKSLGDLLDYGAVQMSRKGCNGGVIYEEYQPVSIHLTVTGRCYARCKGCINAAVTTPGTSDRHEKPAIADAVPERDARAISNLLKENPQDDAVICFYGGEPLLAPELILDIMRRVEADKHENNVRYMLYSNGDLLQKTAQKYPQILEHLWLLSVSIDGRREQHDRIRIGTSLDLIHQGLGAVRSLSPASVLMWSTLREEQSLADCFLEFVDLFEASEAGQFFWHWVETEEPFADFVGYLEKYENDLRMVMKTYVDRLEEGKILPLVHVNELVLFLLSGKARNSSACGVELSENYDLIDGKIHSCADLPPELAIGDIDGQGNLTFLPHDLMRLVSYKDSLGCSRCGVHAYCGGRCPVQAHAGSPERLLQYCQLMRLHVGTVLNSIGLIVAAMKKNGITAQQMYNESAIFAQFTDVTP
jgi:uncharacterized protein